MRRLSRTSFALLCLAASPALQAGPSLEHAVARDEVLERGAWSSLTPLMPPAGLTIAAGGPRPDTPPLVAEDLSGVGGIRWQSGPFARGAWRWQAGLSWRRTREPRVGLDGTALVYDLGGADGSSELYASVQRRHWGPGWVGSLILDGAAPAVPAFGWRRTIVQRSSHPWLEWIGPWGADAFFGRLQGHATPARPYLLGMRIQLAPNDRLDIGLSRTMQWGGRGRDESSSSLVNALLGNDNVGFDGITRDNEPGNQLAGIDVRWVADPVTQTAFHLQIVGEDEAGHLPSRNMLLIGADARVPTATGQLRFFAEFADLLSGRISDDARPLAAYRHSVYAQGYTQEGFSLGHAAGGDSRLASAGWLYRTDTWQAIVVASAGSAEPTAQFFSRGRILGLNASLQARLDPLTHVGLGAAWWGDRAWRRQTLQVWVRTSVFWAPGRPVLAPPPPSRSPAGPQPAPRGPCQPPPAASLPHARRRHRSLPVEPAQAAGSARAVPVSCSAPPATRAAQVSKASLGSGRLTW